MVDWIYEVFNQLIEGLTCKDNHRQSRAAQFFSNLAISDHEKSNWIRLVHSNCLFFDK